MTSKRAFRISQLDAGIFLVSFAVLLIQLLLTRIFSVTMYYHLSFMVVSLAMLGFGASGLLVSLMPRWFPEHKLQQQTALAALVFALTSVAAIWISFQLPISLESSLNWGRLAIVYVTCAVPFIFGGLVVSLLLSHRAAHANRLYFFDLVGAALGCLALIPTTNRLGAPSAVLLAAAIAAVAAAVLAAPRPRFLRVSTLGVAALLLVGLFANLRWNFYDVRFVKGAVQERTLALRWNSFSRVDVLGTPQSLWTPISPTAAGFSSRLDPAFTIPEVRLRYDADADTQITYFDGNLQRLGHLTFDVSSTAYKLRRHHNVLILGPGGGRDILMALVHGSGPVTGVEINPLTVELMRTRFRTFTGGLYAGYPGVTVVNDDARSFIGSAREQYDLIEASLVDTWAASAAGAYALTENNLYTVEAFEEYLERLTPHGMIAFNRWFSFPPVESLRVVGLAREALQRRGVKNPADHVMVVRTDPDRTHLPSLGSILVKRSAFSPAEVETARTFAADMGFLVSYAPGNAAADENSGFHELLGPNPAALAATLPFDLSPVTDDRPFFFSRVPVMEWVAVRLGLSQSRVGEGNLDHGGQTLLICTVATALATALLLVLPYWASRRRARAPRGARIDTRRGILWALYFSGLGLGFILIEIVLIQRFSLFLGYPVYSLSVVLFTMLLATGIGSLASGSLTSVRALPTALACLTALLVLYAVGLPLVLSATRGLPTAGRIAIAVTTILPLGLLMGVPFATGIRRAGGESSSIVPWAWAVNGGTSVFGSTLSVLISMTYGFTACFLVGAFAYLLSFAMAVAVSSRTERVTGGSLEMEVAS